MQNKQTKRIGSWPRFVAVSFLEARGPEFDPRTHRVSYARSLRTAKKHFVFHTCAWARMRRDAADAPARRGRKNAPCNKLSAAAPDSLKLAWGDLLRTIWYTLPCCQHFFLLGRRKGETFSRVRGFSGFCLRFSPRHFSIRGGQSAWYIIPPRSVVALPHVRKTGHGDRLASKRLMSGLRR